MVIKIGDHYIRPSYVFSVEDTEIERETVEGGGTRVEKISCAEVRVLGAEETLQVKNVRASDVVAELRKVDDSLVFRKVGKSHYVNILLVSSVSVHEGERVVTEKTGDTTSRPQLEKVEYVEILGIRGDTVLVEGMGIDDVAKKLFS